MKKKRKNTKKARLTEATAKPGQYYYDKRGHKRKKQTISPMTQKVLQGIEESKKIQAEARARRRDISKAKGIIKQMKKAGFTPRVVRQTEEAMTGATEKTKAKAAEYFMENEWVQDFLSGNAKYIPTRKYWQLVDILEEYSISPSDASDLIQEYVNTPENEVTSTDWADKDDVEMLADQIYDWWHDYKSSYDDPTEDRGFWGEPSDWMSF